MFDERGAEVTSDVSIVHYCDRWIVFGRQDAGEGRILRRGKFADWLIMVVRAFSPKWMPDFIRPLQEHGLSSYY